MRYRLSITAEDTGIVTMYNVILIDGNANLVWNQNEDYLYYKKSINGTFILNCHDNHDCYDAILDLSICTKIEMDIWEDGGATAIYEGYFYKRDCTIDEDRGSISFTPKEINVYDCLEKQFDVELNILAPPTTHTIPNVSVIGTDYGDYDVLEFTELNKNTGKLIINSTTIGGIVYTQMYGMDWDNLHSIWYMMGWSQWVESGIYKMSNSLAERNYYQPYSTTFKYVSTDVNGNQFFDMTTKWIRKVIYAPRLNNADPTPVLDYVFVDTVAYSGTNYNISANTTLLTYRNDIGDIIGTGGDTHSGTLTNKFEEFTIILTNATLPIYSRTYTRAKKLDDIIKALIEPCGFTDYHSEFFHHTEDAISNPLLYTLNPISTYDTSNIFISQISDCIWRNTGTEETPVWEEPTDPATKGMITLKQLLDWFRYAFQVYPYIHSDGMLYFEHIRWYKNGHTYAPQALDGYRNSWASIGALTPLDIEVMYVNFAKGMNKYSYEGEIPLFEKLVYGQAWNPAYIGVPISYAECVDNNITNEFSLTSLCADLDMGKMIETDTDVSNEGFFMFICDQDENVLDDMCIYTSQLKSNGHLSIGNLQYYYWRDDRWIENVLMNDVETVTYNPKKIRKQVDIKIPMCFTDFNPYAFVKTGLGSDEIPPLYGEVETAEWSFKTKMLTLKLRYEC